ncbi:hypothetical protein BDK51DRAFT_50452 [Blyttiomyces helicus]|uniref:Uncharacterized protein n=1 Tax=Blyttiomyces helicus TaxID=388810 RepID=A0A4P9WCQ9_9FUNG|nr:hypothetical protein BDK51DRAFT_50452 [Blyttiomyces helicus]|eukprot:RKO90459.1 hypothetical protein BDK51DRAFT_50452 [Blyttiomyces helicus]
MSAGISAGAGLVCFENPKIIANNNSETEGKKANIAGNAAVVPRTRPTGKYKNPPTSASGAPSFPPTKQAPPLRVVSTTTPDARISRLEAPPTAHFIRSPIYDWKRRVITVHPPAPSPVICPLLPPLSAKNKSKLSHTNMPNIPTQHNMPPSIAAFKRAAFSFRLPEIELSTPLDWLDSSAFSTSSLLPTPTDLSRRRSSSPDIKTTQLAPAPLASRPASAGEMAHFRYYGPPVAPETPPRPEKQSEENDGRRFAFETMRRNETALPFAPPPPSSTLPTLSRSASSGSRSTASSFRSTPTSSPASLRSTPSNSSLASSTSASSSSPPSFAAHETLYSRRRRPSIDLATHMREWMRILDAAEHDVLEREIAREERELDRVLHEAIGTMMPPIVVERPRAMSLSNVPAGPPAMPAPLSPTTMRAGIPKPATRKVSAPSTAFPFRFW